MHSFIKLTWADINKAVSDLSRRIVDKPEIIVTVGRGGNIPGTMLSYVLNVKTVNCFSVQSYNDDRTASHIIVNQAPYIKSYKNILVIDDLADKGTTLSYVKSYFDAKEVSPTYGTLYIKSNTTFTPDYYTKTFDANEWIEFPWDDLSSF